MIMNVVIVSAMADILNLALGLWSAPWMMFTRMAGYLKLAVELSYVANPFKLWVFTLTAISLTSALYASSFIANPIIFAPAFTFLIGKSIANYISESSKRLISTEFNNLRNNFDTRKSCYDRFKDMILPGVEQSNSFLEGYDASDRWAPYLKSFIQYKNWRNSDAFKAGMHVGYTLDNAKPETDVTEEEHLLDNSLTSLWRGY